MRKLILFFALISFLIPVFSFAQAPQEAWVARYNGSYDHDDVANAIAVDDYGNVYVTGESKGNGSGYDYVTIKYDPNGNKLWEARYNGPGNSDDRAVAIAVEDDGEVYVTGESKGSGTALDYATIKYGPQGNQLWVVRYNGPANSEDRAHAIALDNYGNVYVTGESKGHTTNFDYATIKYGSSGNQVWAIRYNGPVDYHDSAYSIALDSGGNVYVTGESSGSGTCLDFATVKYDSNGNELWIKRSNGAANSHDSAYAIAVDSSGNVYVTGQSKNSTLHYEYLTIKYSTNGTKLWSATYSGPANNNDVAHAIAVDSSGNVYVTGESKGIGTYLDYATIKYDTNGNVAWIVRYNGLRNKDDIAYAIAVDSTGNVYVTGESRETSDYPDYVTIKYDSSGSLIWLASYNGTGNKEDIAHAIAVNSSGNVCVTGESKGQGTYLDYATVCYAQLSAGISATPSSHNFGSVNVGGSSAAHTFTVTNTGTANLVIGTITLTGTNPGEFGKQSDNCSGQTIAPSGTCTVQAVFSPTSAGIKNANLSIPSNASGSPTLVSLNGTGMGVTGISATPSSHNFGSVNVGSSSAAQTFTVTNTGTANLVIGTITLTGTNPTQFSKQNDNCSGQTIVPSGTCTVQAVFSPTSAGAKSADLSIPSNAPTVNVPLSGTGTAPGSSASPSSKNFGAIVVGSSSGAQTFTVTNTGTANLIVGTITLTGTDPTQFSKQNDNCSGQTIVPSGTCTVQAVFSPTSAGGMNANLSIPSNASGSPTLVSLNGTGTIPISSVSPSSYNFGAVNVGNSSAAHTFTVTNTGTANLVIGTISLTGTNPGEFGKQSDNCSGQTIAPSGSCTVQAVFSPTSEGGKNADLSIPSNAPTVNVPLNGTGTIPGSSVSPTSYNFGNIIVDSSSGAQTFTVSNTGTANLVIGTISLTGTNPGEFSKQNDNCSGQTIAPSGSCTVQAVFSPTSEGGKNADLSIPSNAPGSPKLVALSGTGTVPISSVSPTSYNFGNIVVGNSSAAHTFTVTNTGTANLVIGTISLTGTNPGEFSKQNDNCSGQTIAPSGSCTVQAVFSPTSEGGKNADLSIPSNAPGSPKLVALSGTGTVPISSVSPTSYNFGSINVGSSSGAQTFTVTSTGTANLVIGTISLTGTNPGEFGKQNDNCSGQTIAPSGSCTLQAVFSPTSANGKNANLSIPSNASGSPTLVALSGTGMGVPGISPTPTSYNFGSINVGSSSGAQTFTVTSTGTANLVIGTISLTGTNPGEFGKQNDNCSGQTIAPSGSCTVQAVFSPTSANGKNANLSIPSNASGSPTLVALSGTGMGVPGISPTPTSYNFGSINVGSSSGAQTFTVTSTGTANLVIGTISLTGTNPGEFSKQNDNCSGQTIVPSGSCTVQAVFSPTSANGKSADLSIPSNAPGSPKLVPLSGTGVGVACISATPSSHNFGSVIVGSSSGAQTFTVSNTCTANLVIGTITLTGANPGEFGKQNDNCSGQTIAPSGSCTLQAVFSPTSAGGKSASLSIPSNAPGSPTLVSLNGNGTGGECTIYVPQNYPTIQQAIDAATNGCTILVSTGNYVENINFHGKAIRVKGVGTSGPCGCPEEGMSKVSIMGKYDGSVVTFNTGETRNSILEGFTIKNGFATLGGGILIGDASPTILDCYINKNSAYEAGGGIYITGNSSSPLIFNNLIVGNFAQSAGGEARGGGIYVTDGASPEIQSCTIADNTSSTAGAGGIHVSSDSAPVITDSIIWRNSPADLTCETGCNMDVTYSDVGAAISGIGNISIDPLFVTGTLGSYYLSHIRAGQDNDSSCIDSGSTTALNAGLDTRNTANDGITDRGRVDMGYHNVPTPVFIKKAWTSKTTYNRGEAAIFFITYRIEGNPETMYEVTNKIIVVSGSVRGSFTKVESHYPGLYTTQMRKIVPNTFPTGQATVGYVTTVKKQGETESLGTDIRRSLITIN